MQLINSLRSEVIKKLETLKKGEIEISEACLVPPVIHKVIKNILNDEEPDDVSKLEECDDKTLYESALIIHQRHLKLELDQNCWYTRTFNILAIPLCVIFSSNV